MLVELCDAAPNWRRWNTNVRTTKHRVCLSPYYRQTELRTACKEKRFDADEPMSRRRRRNIQTKRTHTNISMMMYTRAGRRSRLSSRPPKRGRLVLVNRRASERADLDINGNVMSEEAIAKRTAGLALCFASFEALKNAATTAATLKELEDEIERAKQLFINLGMEEEEEATKKEAFLLLRLSGLLELYVDIALKNLEEWSLSSSVQNFRMMSSVLVPANLEYADEVGDKNLDRCKKFVEEFMPHHRLPEEDTTKALLRWTWFNESEGDEFARYQAYLERYIVETFKEESLPKIEEVYEYSKDAGNRVIDQLIQELEGLRADHSIFRIG